MKFNYTCSDQINDKYNVLFVHELRISRDINPSPAIENFRNLNEEVYLLGAIGSVSGKCLNFLAE